MARKQVLVSDVSGNEIQDGKGAVVRVIFNDARRGIREFDVTDDEAQEYSELGRAVARRGRKPKGTTSSSDDNGNERGAKGGVAAAVGGRGSKS